ncbi:MAG: family hydrolase [Acidobacteriales bacterium]|nr:family hydrolase [Terriglobales bacterium]
MPTKAAGCVFCKIAGGSERSHVVFEDEVSLAFLDARPLFAGHTLLIAKAHVETLSELRDEDVGRFFGNVRMLSGAVERAMGAEGTFVAINNKVSQSVPHLHVHVVPRKKGDGLRGFFWPRSKYASEEEMAAVAELVRREWQKKLSHGVHGIHGIHGRRRLVRLDCRVIGVLRLRCAQDDKCLE